MSERGQRSLVYQRNREMGTWVGTCASIGAGSGPGLGALIGGSRLFSAKPAERALDGDPAG